MAQVSKRATLERLVSSSRFAEAEQQLWDVLQADPTQGWALDLLGDIRTRQKRDAEAEALFQRAFGLNSRDVRALHGLGDLARKRGDTEGSIRWYSKLIEVAPNDVRARKTLSILQEETGKFQESVQSILGIPLASRTPDLLPVLAANYLALHQDEKVEPLISRILKLPGHNSVKLDFVAVLVKNGYLKDGNKLLEVVRPARPDSDYLHMLARIREAQGQSAESWNFLQQALKLQPKSFNLLFDCARFAAQHDQWDDAVTFLQRADEVNPDQPEVLKKLSLALLKIHHREKAVSVAKRLNAISPEDPDAEYILAFALVDNEHWATAEPIAAKVVKARPMDEAALLLMGIVYLQEGKMSEARAAVSRSLEINPNLQDARYYSALISERMGDMDGAREELDALVKLAPNHAGGQAQLGVLRLRSGDLAGARTALEAAVRLEPEVSQSHYQLGLVYERLGLRTEAAAEMVQYEKLRGTEDSLRRDEVGIKVPQ